MSNDTLLTEAEIADGLKRLPDWTREGDTIRRTAEARTFMAGIRVVDTVAEAAEVLNHHPDIDIRWTSLTFALSTHSKGGLTGLDFQLAARIDQVLADEA
ncbi:4a-hydroxytetrahydrobiopterin dehydratase [Kitasatospora sp. LaBMicrA B282]|uniref:4a-hydroxytetrahydrobiopterin dehydratase n=1 Tax=Kitasatospora sp. LaBMicrA B282 TaxID=3420949 RepID=UPI003D0E6681